MNKEREIIELSVRDIEDLYFKGVITDKRGITQPFAKKADITTFHDIEEGRREFDLIVQRAIDSKYFKIELEQWDFDIIEAQSDYQLKEVFKKEEIITTTVYYYEKEHTRVVTEEKRG